MILSKIVRDRKNTGGQAMKLSMTFDEVRFAQNPQIVSSITIPGQAGGAKSGASASGGGGSDKKSGTADAGVSGNKQSSQSDKSIAAAAFGL